ncbi:MAG: class I SAM-dependent methyltransferase [Austwickia sp.]|nr:class I SAM-dependent methyltransferase [Austwickia sp.]MBK8437065.1 class I SAM-dependent methyltransferase [Austwickia sp.]MBK9102300.1 class I SAM-dependent methyltransferase [Austwickia sp.]
MDAKGWDERYSGAEFVWPRQPNRWVVQEVRGNPPGRALDLATGEGRNAIWLAEIGWSVTAVDFSEVALRRAAGLEAEVEEERGEELAIEWVWGDLRTWELPTSTYDLVLMSYLHLPSYERTALVRAGAAALAANGMLVVVGHDSSNLTDGYGGPQDAGVLYTAADLETDLQDLIKSGGYVVERSGRFAREVVVGEESHVAWDVILKVRRKGESKSGYQLT